MRAVAAAAMASMLVHAACGRVAFDDRAADARVPLDDGGDGNIDAQARCFRDTFDGTDIDPARWARFKPNALATVEVVGGELVVTVPPSMNDYAGLFGDDAFDLATEGNTAQVEVLEVTNQSGGGIETTWSIYTAPDQHYYSFSTGSWGIWLTAELLGVQDRTQLAWNATAMRHWRLRREAGELVFETSPDATTWTERARGAAPPVATAMNTELIVAAYSGGNPAPGRARFDNVLDVTPACPRP